MIAELLVVLLVFIGGCAVMRTLGVTGLGLPPLGFLAGICLLLGIGFLQVVTALPTAPAITVALTFGLPVGWWIVRWRRGHDVAVSLPMAAGTLAAVAVAVAALRTVNMFKWHTDSITYLMAARLLAEGDYRSTASIELVTTRVLGMPLLHAPAGLDNALYLRSITPLLAAATLAAIVWFLRQARPSRFAIVATLAAFLLLTNNRFVFSFFYLNGHLLFGASVLLIAGSGWLLATGGTAVAAAEQEATAPRRALMALQVMAIPVLVITRPEGYLMGVLVVLPTLLSARIPRRHRSIAMAVLGGTILLFAGFQGWVFLDRDVDIPASVLGALVLGVGVLAAVPLLRWTFPQRHGTRLLALAEAGLWLGLLALALREPSTLRISLHAMYRNVFEGAGGYGLSIALLCGLLLLGWLLSPSVPFQAHLRFPVTTFVPLGLILAYLRGGPYRAADADSMNRMLIHVVPLAVLFLFVLWTSRERPSLKAEDALDGGAGAAGGAQVDVQELPRIAATEEPDHTGQLDTVPR